MSFLSTGAFTIFTANTKAKSAEVNANFAALAAFLNTTTSDVLVGSVWQKVAETTSSYTFSTTDNIRTLLFNMNTTVSSTVQFPSATACSGRIITVVNRGTLAENGLRLLTTESFDGIVAEWALYGYGSAVTFHSDGTNWKRVEKAGAPGIFASSTGYTFTNQKDITTALITTGSTNCSVSLPSNPQNDYFANHIFEVKKVDSGTGRLDVTDLSVGGIDGTATVSLFLQYDSISLKCKPDGTGWNIISKYNNPEWQNYTPTVTNMTSATVVGRWRRAGDSMEVRVNVISATTVSGVIQVPLPTGYNINTAKLPSTSNAIGLLGVVIGADASPTTYTAAHVTYNATASVRVISVAHGDYWGTTIPWTWAVSDAFTMEFTVPILEFGR